MSDIQHLNLDCQYRGVCLVREDSVCTHLASTGKRKCYQPARAFATEWRLLQSEQIAELLEIIERQGSHLEQYRSVLDAQRQSNSSLNADCERIQARSALLSFHTSICCAGTTC